MELQLGKRIALFFLVVFIAILTVNLAEASNRYSNGSYLDNADQNDPSNKPTELQIELQIELKF